MSEDDEIDDPCPDCGAESVNLVTPEDIKNEHLVSIGCRECGWEAVQARAIQLSPQVKRQLNMN